MKALKYTAGSALGLLAAGLFMAGFSGGAGFFAAAAVALVAGAGLFAWAGKGA